MITQFMVNGVPVEAHFDEESVRNVLQPLADAILLKAQDDPGRMVVLLAAPPAAGKSTLAAEFLSRGWKLFRIVYSKYHGLYN